MGVSTLHTIKIDVISPASSSTDYQHCNYIYDIIGDFFIRDTFQDLAGYPRILGIVV
jgi:phage terminase large subunit-like protein